MTAIWQTLGKQGDPVDGQVSDFRFVEGSFGTIKQRMFELAGDFDGIRTGTSDDFKGDAADAFRDKLNLIAKAVGEVPQIAAQLEGTFRAHRVELERLKVQVDAAVARAQTNWNEKCNADADNAGARNRLSFVDKQIDWLDSIGDGADESDKAYWTRERIEASTWVTSSSGRVHRADDNLDESRQDWRTLHDAEAVLDERTAATLRSTVLWSLGDPSTLEQLGDAFGDLYEAFKDLKEYVFSMDFLEDIYHFLDAYTLVLSVISLLLKGVAAVLALTVVGAPIALILGTVSGAIDIAVIALGIVKTRIGIVLVQEGRLEPLEFWVDTALFAATLGFKAIAHFGAAGLSKFVSVGSLDRIYRGGVIAKEGFELGDNGVTIVKTLRGDPFDYDYHADDVAREAASHVSSSISHFDFDPPPAYLFRPTTPLLTVPTLWFDDAAA